MKIYYNGTCYGRARYNGEAVYLPNMEAVGLISSDGYTLASSEGYELAAVPWQLGKQ